MIKDWHWSSIAAVVLSAAPAWAQPPLLPEFHHSDVTALMPQQLEISGSLAHAMDEFFIADSNWVPIAGVDTFRWVARPPLVVLRMDLFAHFATQPGLYLVPETNYGSSPLYSVRTLEETALGYISLIDLQGTTLVVLWHQNPHQQ